MSSTKTPKPKRVVSNTDKTIARIVEYMSKAIQEIDEGLKSFEEHHGIIADTKLREEGKKLHLGVALPGTEDWKDEIRRTRGRFDVERKQHEHPSVLEYTGAACFDKVVKKEGLEYICMDFSFDKESILEKMVDDIYENTYGKDFFYKDKKGEIIELVKSKEEVSKTFKEFATRYISNHVLSDLSRTVSFQNVLAKEQYRRMHHVEEKRKSPLDAIKF